MKGHVLQLEEVSDQVKAVTFHHVLNKTVHKIRGLCVQAENTGAFNCADVHVLLGAAVGDCLVSHKTRDHC